MGKMKSASLTSSRTRVSAKGQVVIPKALREAKGWEAGTELVVEPTADGLTLRAAHAKRAEAAADLLGCTGYRGPRRTLAEMGEAIARGARGQR